MRDVADWMRLWALLGEAVLSMNFMGTSIESKLSRFWVAEDMSWILDFSLLLSSVNLFKESSKLTGLDLLD